MSQSLYDTCSFDGGDSFNESGVSSLTSNDSFEFGENVLLMSHDDINTESTTTESSWSHTEDNSDKENDVIYYEASDVRRMLETPDVVFILGKEKTRIYGVKDILTHHSKRFRELIHSVEKICRSLGGGPNRKPISQDSPRVINPKRRQSQGQLVIPVSGFETVVFQKVVEFVQFGDIEITIDCVFGLLAATDVFKLPTLRKLCNDYVQSCIETDKVLFLLQAAEPYMLNGHVTQIVDQLLSFVDTNSERIVHHPYFVLTSKQTVAQILSRSTLGISSSKKREAAQRWMDEQYTCHTSKRRNCNTLSKLTKKVIKLFSSDSKCQHISAKSNSNNCHRSKYIIKVKHFKQRKNTLLLKLRKSVVTTDNDSLISRVYV